MKCSLGRKTENKWLNTWKNKILELSLQQIIKVRMNGDYTERIPQEGQCRKEGEGGILESASASARRSSETIKAIAGTAS